MVTVAGGRYTHFLRSEQGIKHLDDCTVGAMLYTHVFILSNVSKQFDGATLYRGREFRDTS